MAKTINWANVSIGFDASKIKAGVDMSRADINRLTGVLKQNADPTKLLERDMRALGEAYKLGAIDAATYTRNMNALKNSIKEQSREARLAKQFNDQLTQSFEAKNQTVGLTSGSAQKASSSFAAMGAKIAAVTAAAYVAKSAFDDMRHTFDSVDKLNDTAKSLGMTHAQLQLFARSLSEVAGMDVSETTNSIKSMMSQVGMAAQGMGKGQKIFEKLGLDPKSLTEMTASAQFDAISAAIARLGTSAERAAIAEKIFGDGRIVNAMAQKSGELQGALAANESAFKLTAMQTASVGKFNDAIARTGNWFSDLKTSMWADVAVGIYGALLSTQDLNAELEKTNKISNDLALEAKMQKQAEQAKEFNRQLADINRQTEILDRGQAAVDKDAIIGSNLTDFQKNQLLIATEILEKTKERKRVEEEEKKLIADQQKALKDKAESVKDSLRTPYQKAVDEVVKLRQLLQAGEITKDQFNQAAQKAADAVPASDAKGVAPLILAGTKEAFDSQRDLIDKQLQEAEKQSNLQQIIADATKETAVAIKTIKPVRPIR